VNISLQEQGSQACLSLSTEDGERAVMERDHGQLTVTHCLSRTVILQPQALTPKTSQKAANCGGRENSGSALAL